MKKLLFGLMFLIFTSTCGATGWDKTKPTSTDAPTTITTTIPSNMVNLDRALSNMRRGGVVSYVSASALSVSAGEVVVSNSDGSQRLMLANTSATSVTWANIDTGSEAASTTYYVYATASATTDTTFGIAISTSASAPTGFTWYAKLGSFYNDGSSNIVKVNDGLLPVGYGIWVSKTVDTVYYASTDGFVRIKKTSAGLGTLLSDANTPPTTVAGAFYTDGSNQMTGVYPVIKGNYWEVTSTNGVIISIEWLSSGS